VILLYKILDDNEIKTLLSIKYENLGQAIEKLKEIYQDFDLEDLKSQFRFEVATEVSGKFENNSKDLLCPNCNGRFVVRTYAGDLYYRLFNGTKSQKEQEKRKFASMGLYNNPWACADENTRDYWCLNCGIRWNGKDKDIIYDKRFSQE